MTYLLVHQTFALCVSLQTSRKGRCLQLIIELL